MAYGKTIELFLVNGTADSIITAELSNWSGKAIKIPRNEVATCNRDDIEKVGIYFLLCKEDDDSDSVYIGEATNVKKRLIQHLRDYQAEKEKYYWTSAIIFTGRDLNKNLVQYLENHFKNLAVKSNRYLVLTKKTSQDTPMKESHIAVMEEFIDNVKILTNTLGYKIFEPLNSPNTNNKENTLYLTTGNAKAEGCVTTEGFVLFKNSKINENPTKSLSKGLVVLREKYINNGKVKKSFTTEDILFSSSSAASSFVLGHNSSGPMYWKTKDGTSLKELEEI